MTTGELIKRARQNSKMTQKELAEKVGVSYQMIQAWENNRRNPKVETMKKSPPLSESLHGLTCILQNCNHL